MTISQRPNLLAPEVCQNPYPLYAELRRSAPVCQVDPGGLWAVSRYEDVLFILKNPRLFSSEAVRFLVEPPWLGQKNPFSDSMLMLDPPRHTRLRSLVTHAFGPTAMARLEPRIRALAEELSTRILERRSIDFVQAFSLPLAAGVIGLLLGLDASLHSRFKQWSDDIVGISTTQPEHVERLAEIRRHLDEMEHYLREVLESRRRQPGNDMVSDLVAARIEGDALSDTDLMGFLFLLLVAGLETTLNLLSNSVWQLARSPELLARLRSDRSLIPRFIEEMLRCEPPVQGTLRLCNEDVVVGGVSLSKGSMVLALMNSALRDEALLPEGDCFSLNREQPRQSLAFGHGIHFCLGAPLARLEARLGMETLLARVDRLTPGLAQPEWIPSLTVRGIQALPIEVHPA